MKSNIRSMRMAYVTSLLLLVLVTIAIPVILTAVIPMKAYAALCAKPDKSTTYFNGYEAGQSDSHSSHPQNQTITGANSPYSQDYKQGYKDGWSDAQYNVNILQNSVC
jgi:hypothetical protein